MQTAEYDYNHFNPTFKNEADKSLLVKFFHKIVPDKSNPGEFTERVYVDIRPAGQRDGVARPASDRDKERFPQHYAAFIARVAPPTEGTPLGEWSMIPRTLVDKLSFVNIKTVEHMANVSDANMPREVAVLGLKQKAKDWLLSHKDDKFLDKMRGDLELRDSRISQLEKQLDSLAAKIEKVASGKGK